MIPIDRYLDTVLKKAKLLLPHQRLEVYPYKRDRLVAIEKQGDSFIVFEDGFIHEQYSDIPNDKLKKILKMVGKQEFPRSNQLHIKLIEKEPL